MALPKLWPASLLVVSVWASWANAQTANVSVALVVQDAPATVDTAATLPVSGSGFAIGTPLYVDVWARTVDPNGLSQVSTDISYDSGQVAVLNIVHTAAFSLFSNGTFDNAVGLIDDLSGSIAPATPPCATAAGFSTWIRVAEVEMVVLGSESGRIQPSPTGSPIFVVAQCGEFNAPQVEYLGADLDTVDTARIELVSLASPSASDQMAILPLSQTEFLVGDTFIVEMWAQTTSARGLSQVSADVVYDPLLAAAQNVTIADAFALFPSGAVDNTNGFLDNVSGSVPVVSPPCSGQIGASPNWARVAVIELTANEVGTQTIQAQDSADPIFVVATCGGFSSPVSSYGSVTVTASCLPSSAPEPELIRGAVSQKNRFLSFRVVDTGRNQAARVTFVDLPAPFDLWNGSRLWVGRAAQVSEQGSSVIPQAKFGVFTAATLSCNGPTYADLGSLGVIHIFHEGIIPGGVYEVDVIDQTCDATDGTLFSAPLLMTNSGLGDILASLDISPAGPPDGDVTINDVLGVIGAFSSTPGAPVKARGDLEGPDGCVDLLMNIGDVLQAIAGFASVPYAFFPSSGNACASTCAGVLPP